MQRLRRQHKRLRVTAIDADVVLLGAGCVPSYNEFVKDELRAMKEKKKSKRALRLAIYGTPFGYLRKMRRAGARCIGEADATISLAHKASDRVHRWCVWR